MCSHVFVPLTIRIGSLVCTSRIPRFATQSLARLPIPRPPVRAFDQPEQEGRTGERRKERPEYPIGFDPKETEDSTTDHTADDTHHDIAQDAQLSP